MKQFVKTLLLINIAFLSFYGTQAQAKSEKKFVVALVGESTNIYPQWHLRQLELSLAELSHLNPKVVVIAFRSGVQALSVKDRDTRKWVKRLKKQGVEFKIGRSSMDLWGLSDDDMPVDIEIVPSGLTELMLYQSKGYLRLKF